ncbi:hypothetical protein IWX81_001706 [Salinibacterium sp. CAN_S4]|uniref:hypothetical protein n=1 Tax=Salinibacterium sp. CAN_S4 TaxID=2787727 RepID=UPI0018F021AC
MFPTAKVDIRLEIPTGATFWVPKTSDIDDEGFGNFIGVWPIVGAGTHWTAEVIRAEAVAAEHVGQRARNAWEFEALARRVEEMDPDDPMPREELADLPFLADPTSNWAGLGSLELGVSGLVHAMSNAGFFPAASCRSHVANSWSPHPVVLFATDEQRLKRLLPLVRAANCGLGIDGARPELLSVYAAAIPAMMGLARSLFADRVAFRKMPKTSRRQRTPRQAADAGPPLF